MHGTNLVSRASYLHMLLGRSKSVISPVIDVERKLGRNKLNLTCVKVNLLRVIFFLLGFSKYNKASRRFQLFFAENLV